MYTCIVATSSTLHNEVSLVNNEDKKSKYSMNVTSRNFEKEIRVKNFAPKTGKPIAANAKVLKQKR